MLTRLKILASPRLWQEIRTWIAFFVVTPVILLLYLLSLIFATMFPRSKKAR
jgi:hypothetical protein